MNRLTEKHWRNLDPWECCGQDRFCGRGCHDLGGCTNGCIVPKLYARLAAYEDTDLTPDEVIEMKSAWKAACKSCGINTVAATTETPNDPLTLDELLEMDGEPVFIVSKRYGNGWCIVQWHGVSKSWMYFSRTGTAEGMTATPITAREYGDDWSAYRRKPEEGTP